MVTDVELSELLEDCPILFHMAERGSWPSIEKHGLLSTSALLDLYGVVEPDRASIEAERRSECIEIVNGKLGKAVIRDQIPMDDRGLTRCLPEYMVPADWYRILNSKVFFWLTEERLHRLTGAAAYRERSHDVLEVDSRSLVRSYYSSIWLCPMNSGCTKPYPHARNERTFARIRDYPYSSWRKKRGRGERVVELSVDYSVPDISRYVSRVVVMKGTTEVEEIYRR